MSNSIFRSARTSCTTSGCLLACPQEKSGSHIYRPTCLMNHQKTRLTSLMAPWDPLDAHLDPLAPPGHPLGPLGPLIRSLGLIQTQDHLVCITNHQRTHQMSLLILWTPWDSVGLPFNPQGSCGPTPWPLLDPDVWYRDRDSEKIGKVSILESLKTRCHTLASMQPSTL